MKHIATFCVAIVVVVFLVIFGAVFSAEIFELIELMTEAITVAKAAMNKWVVAEDLYDNRDAVVVGAIALGAAAIALVTGRALDGASADEAPSDYVRRQATVKEWGVTAHPCPDLRPISQEEIEAGDRHLQAALYYCGDAELLQEH